ncbi:MAG: carboxypeptidase-like regulatory domain-containing protein [Candidatus Poribacteria bacterium]|nr:carboxypeptidase-like regulatory domain-containing protein [Candidatus Poribacteria bacterium]
MKIYRDLFLIKRGCSVLKRAEVVRYFRNLLVITVIFLLCVSTIYSQNDVGNIHGTLTDKKSNKPIANHPVTLNIHKAGDVTQQETTTDKDGNYRFENLALDIETHYTVSTNYNGREHIEKDLVLSSFVPNIAIDIEIGEVTDDPSQIQIKSFTILIGSTPETLAKEGFVVVNEFLNVENLNTSPFQIVRDGETVGFNFDLPKTHKGFHPHPRAPKSLKLSSTGSHIVLTDPLPHGSTLIVYEYLYPVNSAEFDLSRRMPFHTDQIAILIQDGINLNPHSKHFNTPEYEAINGVVYKAYSAAQKGKFSAGKIVDLKLGIPKPESNMGQMAFIAIAAALAGGFLVAAIFMLRRAQRTSKESDEAQPTTTDAGWLRKLSDADLEHARTARLEFITLLDEAQEKQDISERVYNRLRKEQTERLTEILDQRKERGLDN